MYVTCMSADNIYFPSHSCTRKHVSQFCLQCGLLTVPVVDDTVTSPLPGTSRGSINRLERSRVRLQLCYPLSCGACMSEPCLDGECACLMFDFYCKRTKGVCKLVYQVAEDLCSFQRQMEHNVCVKKLQLRFIFWNKHLSYFGDFMKRNITNKIIINSRFKKRN